MHTSQIELFRHILDECEYLIPEAKENTFDDYTQSPRLSRAVCRSLEIIGEAAKKISPDTKNLYPNVPWREMSDIRNRIIHHYFGVDHEIVWDTVTTDIPVLFRDISTLLSKHT